MKIEVVRKLPNGDTLIVNELVSAKTYDVKIKLIKDTLIDCSKEFGS